MNHTKIDLLHHSGSLDALSNQNNIGPGEAFHENLKVAALLLLREPYCFSITSPAPTRQIRVFLIASREAGF